jgi:hypothetical protein
VSPYAVVGYHIGRYGARCPDDRGEHCALLLDPEERRKPILGAPSRHDSDYRFGSGWAATNQTDQMPFLRRVEIETVENSLRLL